MTGTQIISRLGNFVDDDDLDTTEMLAQINLCLDDMSIEAPYETTTELTTTINSRGVTLPSNCMEVQEVYIEGVEIGAARSPFSESSTATGTPNKFYVVEDELELYPLADDVYDVGVVMKASYPHITSLSDDIVGVPSQFHPGIVYWLAAQFQRTDEEKEQAAEYKKDYYRYVLGLKEYQEKRSGAYYVTKEG